MEFGGPYSKLYGSLFDHPSEDAELVKSRSKHNRIIGAEIDELTELRKAKSFNHAALWIESRRVFDVDQCQDQ
jgi:hypothetical protein